MGQEPLGSFPPSLKKLWDYPVLSFTLNTALHCQYSLVLFCHCIYNPNTLEWFPVLSFRNTLATRMLERTLLLVINISQKLQAKLFYYLLQSIFGLKTLKTDAYFPDNRPSKHIQ